MFVIPFWARALAVCLAVAALLTGYKVWTNHQQKIGEDRAWVKFDLAMAKQKAEAAEKIKTLTADVKAAEKLLHDFKNAQEIKDIQNAKTISGLSTRLRNLGRLRDPSAVPGCGPGSGGPQSGNPTSPGSGPNNTAETSGLLSESTSELLRRIVLEADEINVAYISCRADSLNLRSKQGSTN